MEEEAQAGQEEVASGLGEMLRVVGSSVWKVDSKCGPLGLMGKGTEPRRPPPRLLCDEVWGFGMPLPSLAWALEPPWGGGEYVEAPPYA